MSETGRAVIAAAQKFIAVGRKCDLKGPIGIECDLDQAWGGLADAVDAHDEAQAQADRDRERQRAEGLAARVESLEKALAEAAIPLEAFHMDLENAWELSETAKTEIRNAVRVIRAALRGGEGAGE